MEHVTLILNHYEQIAIGIREGILDEPILRRCFQTGFVRDWESSAELVSRIRRDHRSSLFTEFEELASRWCSEGLLKKSVAHLSARPSPHHYFEVVTLSLISRPLVLIRTAPAAGSVV
jgi:hypothetical protein